MAVIEGAVHPSTEIGPGHKVGCWNKPRPAPGSGYFAPARIVQPDGSFTIGSEWVPYRMSIECRYDQRVAPEQCASCQWQAGSAEYDAKVRAEGSA